MSLLNGSAGLLTGENKLIDRKSKLVKQHNTLSQRPNSIVFHTNSGHQSRPQAVAALPEHIIGTEGVFQVFGWR
jgi:hypothetical protein